jgi:hypothetical protein
MVTFGSRALTVPVVAGAHAPGADALQLIAAWGLSNGAVVGPFTPLDWATLLGLIRFERITGLAVEAAHGGGLQLTNEQDDELLRLHRAAMSWCLFAEQKLLHLANAMEGAGIEYAVLKGPALAHTVYTEPCLRPFGDLDLLVRSREYDGATALMARLGYVRRRPEPRPGWEARFGKASVHVHPDDGVEIDLHRALVLGPFGQWIEGDELMDHRSTFGLAGRELPRLDDTGMLVNVAVHASLGSAVPRVVPLRDVVEVAMRGRIETARLSEVSSAGHLGVVLERARNLARETLGVQDVEPLAQIPSGVRPSEQRLLQTFVGSSRRDAALPLATIKAIPGLNRKIAYAVALAFPSREFLRARGTRSAWGTFVARWRRAAHTFRGRIGGPPRTVRARTVREGGGR